MITHTEPVYQIPSIGDQLDADNLPELPQHRYGLDYRFWVVSVPLPPEPRAHIRASTGSLPLGIWQSPRRAPCDRPSRRLGRVAFRLRGPRRETTFAHRHTGVQGYSCRRRRARWGSVWHPFVLLLRQSRAKASRWWIGFPALAPMLLQLNDHRQSLRPITRAVDGRQARSCRAIGQSSAARLVNCPSRG